MFWKSGLCESDNSAIQYKVEYCILTFVLFKSEIIKFINFSIVFNSFINPTISATEIYVYIYISNLFQMNG